MSNNLDLQLRDIDGTTGYSNKDNKLSYTQREIHRICLELTVETVRYDPLKSVRHIESYIGSEIKMERILYSEISNYVQSLNMEKRGKFATNVEKLLFYTLDDKKCASEDCRKIVIKIYDHFHLVLNQIRDVEKMFAKGIEDTTGKIEKELKGIQKEYITILGIFAAIVFAFVGGIAFSSSVLQNMAEVSIYRLLLIVDMLAFVLINVIHMLFKFIIVINDKNMEIFKIDKVNYAIYITAVVIIIGWILNVHDLPSYISQNLPWCK